jgi:cobalt/nickel transport system ATP-binding protein
MDTILSLDSVSFGYVQNRPALSDINLKVEKGEIFTIVGSNGSGKSTLLHILGGLLFPQNGEFQFNGQLVNEEKLKSVEFNRYFRSHIGYVFQNPDVQLFCPTVLDELIFAPQQLGIGDEEAMKRAQEVMEMLNIDCLADRPTYMLSGGEKKRVAIGAILTSNPEVLIIDEPVSGLDPKTRSFLIELIFTLNKAGKTIVIATHHLELVNHFQSRVLVLSEKHRIEKIGSCDEILSDTDMLLRTNLIGLYPHRHDGTIHKHLPTGFLFHSHNSQHKH